MQVYAEKDSDSLLYILETVVHNLEFQFILYWNSNLHNYES